MSGKLNGSDLFESLTGFEEIAIAQRFGRTVLDLASSDQTMFGRALVFAGTRREGATDDDAWQTAMEMPLKQVQELVAEADEDESLESGKAEPELEPLPETSPAFV
ncbi:MAG TPA: hypothetical protein VFH56_06560 [Acidimicrobiales bacterium]|nr:hypothetical protein [Acidimicrobiales bacterium]